MLLGGDHGGVGAGSGLKDYVALAGGSSAEHCGWEAHLFAAAASH